MQQVWSSVFNIDYSMIVVEPLQWQTYHKLRSLMEIMFLPLIFSSGGSVYNVYAEEEEDGESSAAAQQSLENFITMTKMKLLKAKMEDMNLNKKVGRQPAPQSDRITV